MARSLCGVKFMSGLVFDGFVSTLTRRGYGAGATAAAQRVASGAAAEQVPAKSSGRMMKKEGEGIESIEKMAWMPDPVTGYYRPENNADEIDVVDLRAMLLKPRRNFIN